jgi:hypothetical protein
MCIGSASIVFLAAVNIAILVYNLPLRRRLFKMRAALNEDAKRHHAHWARCLDAADKKLAEARFLRDAWKFANIASRTTLSQQTFDEEES